MCNVVMSNTMSNAILDCHSTQESYSTTMFWYERLPYFFSIDSAQFVRGFWSPAYESIVICSYKQIWTKIEHVDSTIFLRKDRFRVFLEQITTTLDNQNYEIRLHFRFEQTEMKHFKIIQQKWEYFLSIFLNFGLLDYVNLLSIKDLELNIWNHN